MFCVTSGHVGLGCIGKLSELGSGGTHLYPSAQEVVADESLSSRTDWSTECVPGQPRLSRETFSFFKKKVEFVKYIL